MRALPPGQAQRVDPADHRSPAVMPSNEECPARPATPNGQAAFLFLLTSALAPLIRLSYGRMVIMALPYTVVPGGVGLAAVLLFI